MRLLACGERSAGELASHFSVTHPAISQHLKVLRQARLVNERRDGTRRLYSVRTEALAELHSFLDEVLPAALDHLKWEIEEETRVGGVCARN